MALEARFSRLLVLLTAVACRASLKETNIRIDEPDFDLQTAFGVDALLAGHALQMDRYMVPLEDQRPRLNPHFLTAPVLGCDMARHQPCFLKLDEYGSVGIFSGTGPSDPAATHLKYIGGPDGAASASSWNAEPMISELALQEDGNLVVRSVDFDGKVLWSAESSLPNKCYAGTACAKEAHVSLMPDGSLALFLGLSSAARAYLEVGLPALTRLENCLWHNDFTGESADAPRRAAEASGGQCHPPVTMQLISFPSSGTSFTMMAITKSTNDSAYTSSVFGCPGNIYDTGRSFCGKDSWGEYGICPQTNWQGAPEPGKGTVVKNHVVGRDDEALCSEHVFQRGLEMTDTGIPLDSYGYARLFRNPFDNIVGRMHHKTDDNKLKVTYSKEGFLAEDAVFPEHDIWTYLYWHLSANLALIKLNKPTALLNLRIVDRDEVTYIRYMTKLLGYSEDEIPQGFLERFYGSKLSPEDAAAQPRFRSGDADVPVHIDFYDAPTVHYFASAIDMVLEGSACMTRHFCVKPPDGFRDDTILNA